MVTARTEKQYHIAGFTGRMVDIPITARDSLSAAIKKVDDLPFGSTDASLPPQDAKAKKIPVDAFVVYTDNETWCGGHPTAKLKDYRKAMGIQSKLISVGMTATNSSIADPKDPLQLDVVGFSADTPQAINAFIGMDD
jgi:60 kDa SS-A/Ro ribonucleoprotein